ncbi:hypothetical protein [Rossellomorea vietnamensis]|uniref:hypothetical protein n=1 Tax=Rossellomorea vietnamensis TaxID=218284 RepID=UPI001653A0E4|nr:hypothetical protein [Rossellomorea vietnamensis]
MGESMDERKKRRKNLIKANSLRRKSACDWSPLLEKAKPAAAAQSRKEMEVRISRH